MENVKEELVQQTKNNLVDSYLHNYHIVDEYLYPNLSTSYFSYFKKPDLKKKGKYLDDGVCDVCGKDHQYVLIAPKTPKMCYKCYETIRAYKSLLYDVLRLKKKNILDIDDCKRIVKYMKTYSKVKLLALAVLGASLSAKKK